MLVTVANSLFQWGKMFFQSLITDWGIIGFGIVCTFILVRVVNFIKRFFR